MTPRSPEPFAFLPMESPTAAEIRAFDWSNTELGPVETWPPALKTMLATMFDTPRPMFLAVEAGQQFFFNDPYRPMLGRRLQGAIGKSFRALWHDVWDEVERHVELAMRGEGSMHLDLPLRMTRHGFEEETWWTFSFAPMRDEHGKVFGMYAITNETTRAVRTTQTLRELNASLEVEIDQRTRERDQVWAIARDLYVVMTRDGHYRNVNPAWRTELGYAPDDLMGVGFEELIHPDDLDRARDAVSQMIDGEVVEDLELRIRSKDGQFRWFAWTGVPDGDVIYGMGRDTQRRRAMDDQMRHAQKLEALGRLTGGIAHDFNNILGGIGGAIEVVTERMEQGRVDGSRRLLDAARGAVQRAAGLTHRLLAYSRQQALSLSDVDANGIVHGLDLLLRPLLGEQVNLQVNMTESLWRTLSDASQLESAILNLAINGRDAMPHGGTLTIATRNAESVDIGRGASDYVVVDVTDTGTGMSASVIEKAFDPFFTTKAIGQGTGLGLSMVDGFARQTGGRAIITSAPGRGTTVSLWLPRHIGAPAAKHSHIENRSRQGGGRHVLLVEDEAMLRSLTREVLEEAGYTVSDCAEGNEALLLLAAEDAPDVLVTDVGLPGMDGRRLAQAARERCPTLPVLFITGYAWEAFADSPVLPEGCAILSKPFSVHALVDAVADLIDGTSA
ncbi:hybrid sensor histidine kinase/response regulator [Luteibacter aegosomatissinici]|uniref:hybrid sensor histidine kinase/response regulator n=1 Tax=Luteibacter aegosomatissinici TaxID=2911539 RepID=UPI001FF99943|nr:PAS domain-containing sensor histidine kinase [Luteibacter aegosomatissinici]UPG96223.1 PAS domain S-box protein [Luteibacter aegosomatissinici]